MFKMHFYVTKTNGNLYHVQNAIMGMMGQHHVHTKKGFKRWMKEIPKEDIHIESGKCECGLNPGEVKDHEGNVTKNLDFI